MWLKKLQNSITFKPGIIRRMASAGDKRKGSDSKSVPAKKAAGPWNMGLKASMEDPELQVFKDDKIVIIKDKYPKVMICNILLEMQS